MTRPFPSPFRQAGQLHEIWQLVRDPMLRMQDVPHADALAEQVMLNPDDAHLRDLFEHVVQQQAGQALASNDPFWPSYPGAGVLPPLSQGRIPIAAMPTGDVLSIPIEGVCKNVLLVGPTGAGKTTWLRLMIAAVLAEVRR